MNAPQKAATKVATTAILLGTLALAGHPALANPAHHGGEASQFAQAQGQPSGEATTGGTAAGQPPAMDHGGMETGMMGDEEQMMDPQMMKRMKQMHGGMMGRMGPGMMGGGMMGGMCPMMMARGDKDLSQEQVRAILEGQIAWTGNKRLKVGTVEQKDETGYVADIVTVDDSLVQRVEVDRSTGAMRPVD